MTNNTKITYYSPLMWGDKNVRLGKFKFNSLRILLDSIKNFPN